MPSALCVKVGKRIRLLRLNREWDQVDLAVHAGVSKTHISGLERGQREICLGVLEKLANAFGVSPAELLK